MINGSRKHKRYFLKLLFVIKDKKNSLVLFVLFICYIIVNRKVINGGSHKRILTYKNFKRIFLKKIFIFRAKYLKEVQFREGKSV